MNELINKVKDALIKDLLQNEQNINLPYLHYGRDVYTRKELAEEIKKETNFGISLLIDILRLSLDLIARNVEHKES